MLLPLLALTACKGPDFPDLEAATLDAVTTVIEVSWAQEDELDEVWVEYGPSFSQRAPVWKTEDGRHRVLIVGHPQLTDVTFRPAGTWRGEDWTGPEQTLTTGPLPSSVPQLELLVDEARHEHHGFIQVGTISQDIATVLWLDRDAEPVWYWLSEEGHAIPDVGLSQDELGVYFLQTSLQRVEDGGVLNWVGLDGQLIESVQTENAHHGVEQVGPGQYTFIGFDVRDLGLDDDVIGDQLMRYDRSSGETESLWSIWDHFEFPGPEVADANPYPALGVDWAHGNCLVWDAERERYLLSFYNIDTIVEIGPEGDQLRSMGEYGELGFGRGTYHHQHCAAPTGPDTFYLFNNYYQGEGSRIDFVTLGEEDVEVSPFYDQGPDLYTRVLGDVDLLPDGRLLTGWGSQGQIVVLSAEGEVDWQAGSFLGTITSNVSWVDDPYQALR